MLILIRGAGDIASGIALRLYRAGMDVIMTELPHPTAIRRTVCFSEALRKSREVFVEDVAAVPLRLPAGALEADEGKAFTENVWSVLKSRKIAVIEDPDAVSCRILHPDAVVDAILAKRNLGTKITDAPVVVAAGPGFTAGADCHAVVETMRGHTLGRVICEGTALPDTGIPGNIGGYTSERVLRAPADGIFRTVREIGDHVEAGEAVAYVEAGPDSAGEKRPDSPVIAALGGVLRGLLPDGTPVRKGMKSGDVDPRDVMDNCHTASDKALAVGGGVLEAVLRLSGELRRPADT
jgi:xanthine dehydrogenase accessory factor